MKRVLSVAALVLAGGVLSACGGGYTAPEDAPTDASVDEFCGVTDDIDTDASKDEVIDAFTSVGTPEDMTDEQRDSWMAYVEVLESIDEDADFSDASDALSESQEDTQAYIEYMVENCA